MIEGGHCRDCKWWRRNPKWGDGICRMGETRAEDAYSYSRGVRGSKANAFSVDPGGAAYLNTTASFGCVQWAEAQPGAPEEPLEINFDPVVVRRVGEVSSAGMVLLSGSDDVSPYGAWLGTPGPASPETAGHLLRALGIEPDPKE